MSINLRQSAIASGTGNTYTQTVNFSTYGGNGDGVTSNASAVTAFNTAYAGFTGRTQLIISPGTYVGGGVLGASGGTGLVISAYGARLKDFSIVQGGQQGNNTSQANLVTVAAGNATVSLVTGAETSRFTSGRWVQVTEGDVIGFGQPTSPWKFEYKKIQSIGSGTLTFTEPLQKGYSSTYPNYFAGSAGEPYAGGPATAYCLTANWDQEIELKGAYILDNGNLFYGKCRSIRYTDCTFETYGPCPTQNLLCVIDRCTTLGTELEVDKLVENLIIRNCNFNAIVFQSPSINNLVADNITIAPAQYWRGVAGGTSVITNLSTPTFWFGLFAYGTATGNAKLVNCSATTASYNTGYRFALTLYGQPGSGALTITGGPVTWAVPGGWGAIVDGSGNFSGITFQVTNIAFSGGVTTISTTLSTPVPGTSGGFSAPWYIVPHPGKDTTLITCTGNSVFTTASGNPPNSPIFGWS